MYLVNPRRKRSTRRKVKAVRRRRRSAPVKKTRAAFPARRRKVVRNRSRRRNRSLVRRSSAPAARRSPVRRRSSHRSSGGKFGGLLTRENITLAGGVVGGSVLTGMLLPRIGSKLPGFSTGGIAVKTAYAAGIPIIAGLLLRKRMPQLGKGLMLSGIVTGLTAAVSTVTARMSTPQTTGAYLNRMNAFIKPGSQMPPGNLTLKSFSRAPLLSGMDRAFASNGWSN